MNEPTSLVTGGTGGIGRAVAVRLAADGHKVLIAGRSRERGAHVVQALTALNPAQPHTHLAADLSLMGDTARLSDQVLQRAGSLDSLVLCAGVFAGRPEWTSEGLERTFALNYLSRFLLATRLLPLLTAAPAGRVVFVANAGQYGDTLDFDAIRTGRTPPRRHLSAASQFANDLLAVELASRLVDSNVEVSCVFPGVVLTEVFRNARGVPAPLRWVARGVQQLVGRSPEEAAETPFRLAHEPTASGSTGRFFGPGHVSVPVPDRAADPQRRRELWEVSQELLRPWLGCSASEAAS